MPAFFRRNPEFSKLWGAQIVSQAGDWLNKVAALSLIERNSGSQAAWIGVGLWFGIEQALRLLPIAFLGPFAGPVADRVPRKLLLVAGDLLRAVLVLGYLTVDGPEDIGRVPILIAAQMGLGIFFEAARQAALPNTVRAGDLHLAIALSSATWSAMLSFGALAGGLLVESFGTDVAFRIDAATYLLSASLYMLLRLPERPRQAEPFRWADFLGFRDLRRGWRHAKDLGIGVALLTKAFWGAAGGLLVLVGLAASTRFGADPQEVKASEAVFARQFGVLYAARGVGTAIGPFLARRFLGSDPLALLRTIRIGFVIAPLAYVGFGWTNNLALAALLVGLAHVGGGGIWVASTSLWQQTVDDRFRGRVHSLDFLGMTVSFSVFALLCGWLFDRGVDLTYLVMGTAIVIAVLGEVWWRLGVPMRERLANPAPGQGEPEPRD